MASIISASTISATALNLSGDTTGILQLATGATPTTAVTIDASQNVGIGTSSPTTKLDVNGTATAKQAIIADGANGNVQFGSTSTYNIVGGVDNEGLRYNVPTGMNHEFRTNTTERMRINSSGNVLMGATSGYTSERLLVSSSTSGSAAMSIVNFNNNQTDRNIYSSSVTTAGTGWFHFTGQSGNGTSVTTNNIHILGNGNLQNTNNSYGAISDIKLKENIVDATPKLEKLMQVKVRNYNLKDNYQQHKQIGVVAQELEQVFPSMIEETPDRDTDGNDLGTTTKSVKYSVFVPMLIKAIQELKAIIDTQQTRITALEAK